MFVFLSPGRSLDAHADWHLWKCSNDDGGGAGKNREYFRSISLWIFLYSYTAQMQCAPHAYSSASKFYVSCPILTMAPLFIWRPLLKLLSCIYFLFFSLSSTLWFFVRSAHFPLKNIQKKELVYSSFAGVSFFGEWQNMEEDRHKLSDLALTFTLFNLFGCFYCSQLLETQFSNLFFSYDVLFCFLYYVSCDAYSMD